MAPKDKMTEYERKRLENIRRNGEMMAALKIQSKASQLSQSAKRQRTWVVQSKSYKQSPEKKSKRDSPVVIRRSLRSRGLPPESADGVSDDLPCKTLKISSQEKISPRVLGPLSMTDAHDDAGSYRALVAALLSIDTKPQVSPPVMDELGGGNVVNKENIVPRVSFDSGKVETEGFDVGIKEEKKEVASLLDLGSMRLETDNIARVVPERIMNVKFLPCRDLRMVVVGNKLGNVGFWNMDTEGGDDDQDNGIHLYRPHTGPISGILVQESCFSKIYSSCYDGYIRMMDAEKEVFHLVHHSDDTIFCLSRPPNEDKGLYFGEGRGGLTVWDEKMGKASSQWFPHEDRINTIHFNPTNPNIMGTGSTDGTARIWDLRKVGSSQPKCLKMVSHNRAVHSAYFSPSGYSLATSSLDDYVGIHNGSNVEDDCVTMIPHYNQTGRWLSSFRAIWGWDDSYVFIGNMKRGIDVISPGEKSVVKTLESPHMTAIPCRFDAHPCQVGLLAGATSGGQVYVWTSS